MNCIAYLVRSSENDLNDFNKSLSLVRDNLLPFLKNTDIVVFHERSFEEFKPKVLKGINIIYKEIEFKLPEYNKKILDEIPELYPHPTHQNGPIAYFHKGFTMGYRHMCRFFFSEIFGHLKEYKSYMRLDTDSFILSPVNYDIFEWFNDHGLVYSFIDPAVQIDNQLVCQGLNDMVKFWLDKKPTYGNIDNIPNGKLYYTNFEICNIDWFLKNKENSEFMDFINKTGCIFSKRWGDHILRYLQINLFCDPKKVAPIGNFHYQHGAIYRT